MAKVVATAIGCIKCSGFSYWAEPAQASLEIDYLVLDVQASVEICSDDKTPSIIDALFGLRTLFNRIKLQKRPLIQPINYFERISIKLKCSLPWPWFTFSLLPFPRLGKEISKKKSLS